jgi:rSAM/selenodomain-associated transferase 2
VSPPIETTSPPRISVIIPVLNEEETISDCLMPLGTQDVEVVVVDGGSKDRTRSLVDAAGFAELITADAGRALQMNAGARAAKGDVLLFLHADCKLPENWIELVGGAVSDPEVVGGRFRLGISENTLSFRLIAFFSTLRSRILGITYGDQAIFVRRYVFESVGGFPLRRIFEDSELCEVICRRGRFLLVEGAVVSSSRRWRACGIWRTVFRMWMLRVLYTFCVSDDRLSRWYRNVR